MDESQNTVEVVSEFLNMNGLWLKFMKYVEEQGYTLEELGFSED